TGRRGHRVRGARGGRQPNENEHQAGACWECSDRCWTSDLLRAAKRETVDLVVLNLRNDYALVLFRRGVISGHGEIVYTINNLSSQAASLRRAGQGACRSQGNRQRATRGRKTTQPLRRFLSKDASVSSPSS